MLQIHYTICLYTVKCVAPPWLRGKVNVGFMNLLCQSNTFNLQEGSLKNRLSSVDGTPSCVHIVNALPLLFP